MRNLKIADFTCAGEEVIPVEICRDSAHPITHPQIRGDISTEMVSSLETQSASTDAFDHVTNLRNYE